MSIKLLRKIYYTPGEPGSFSSAPKLFEAVHKKNPRITKEQTEQWLNQQLTHSLHKPARQTFPRNEYFVLNHEQLAEADLADLSIFESANDKIKYVLTLIDVFSKQAFVRALRTKTANDLKAAFKEIFKVYRPASLRTDEGTEFKNKIISDQMKAYGVNHYFAKDKRIKCSVVERFNRTLKSKMFKYFTSKGTRRYVDVLQGLVASYNDTYHSTVGMTPNEAAKAKRSEVFYNTHGYASPREYMKAKLRKMKKKRQIKLKKDDNVRVSYVTTKMDKGYYPTWTDQVQKVAKVIKHDKQPTVLLQNQNRRFYKEELQKIPANSEFRVEKVIEKGKGKRRGFVLVKWLNHPSSYNSWIKASTIRNG